MVVRVLLALLVLALAGCARAPLSTEGVDPDLAPADVRERPEATRGQSVIWGGVIARAHNLPERTRLEVVGYPLGERTQRPRVEAASTGRFRVYVEGYLETAVYAPGRRITVRGHVEGTEAGRIGDAEYVFPVLDSQALELWPEQRAGENGSRVRFGFGIILGN